MAINGEIPSQMIQSHVLKNVGVAYSMCTDAFWSFLCTLFRCQHITPNNNKTQHFLFFKIWLFIFLIVVLFFQTMDIHK